MAKLFTVGTDRKLVDRTPDGLGMSMPVGSLMMFAGSTPPESWLLCDGSEVSRVTYLALFNAIGVAFGPGDGSTTFNLPDLRGRLVKGATVAGDTQNAGSSTGDISGVTMVPCIKAFGSVAVIEYANVTTQELFDKIAALEAVIAGLDVDVKSTIIYPNGGSAASPANVSTNQRIVMNNPFQGYFVQCEAQMRYNGKWGRASFSDIFTDKWISRGIEANQLLPEDKIILVTGSQGLLNDDTTVRTGHPFEITGSQTTSAPCRVVVTRLGKM